jgi:hypothetical protein
MHPLPVLTRKDHRSSLSEGSRPHVGPVSPAGLIQGQTSFLILLDNGGGLMRRDFSGTFGPLFGLFNTGELA